MFESCPSSELGFEQQSPRHIISFRRTPGGNSRNDLPWASLGSGRSESRSFLAADQHLLQFSSIGPPSITASLSLHPREALKVGLAESCEREKAAPRDHVTLALPREELERSTPTRIERCVLCPRAVKQTRAQEECMEISLADKVAIVTGGSRGIGKGIALALASAGAAVMITSRKKEVLAETAAQIGENVSYHAAHAGNPAQIAACVAATMSRFGAIDILVNNAFTSPYRGPLVDADLLRLDKTNEVNLRGPLVWIQECWTAHMASAGGSVINISSGAGERYGTPEGAYGLSKSGLNYLTRHFAMELAPGVRVNAICPGLIPTDSSRTVSDLGLSVDVPRVPPLGRLGTPADIAHLATFLASDRRVLDNRKRHLTSTAADAFLTMHSDRACPSPGCPGLTLHLSETAHRIR